MYRMYKIRQVLNISDSPFYFARLLALCEAKGAQCTPQKSIKFKGKKM